MKIHKLENSIEKWYIAIGNQNGRIFVGYGTTHTLAMFDAFRDLAIIKSLQ